MSAPILFESVESTSRSATTAFELAIIVHEHDRRSALGLAAVSSRDLLTDLMNLPVGLAVNEMSLRDATRRRFRRCQPGIVDLVDGSFIRQLAAPVEIRSATVSAATWIGALSSLNVLAPHTERHVMLPADELKDPLVRYSAERFGIGIWSDDGVQLAPAEPFVRRRFTPTGWVFTEQAYERWLLSR